MIWMLIEKLRCMHDLRLRFLYLPLSKMALLSTDLIYIHNSQVKKFVYKLTVGDEEVPIKMHGSINHSSGSKYGGSNTWKCPGFFKADIKVCF